MTAWLPHKGGDAPTTNAVAIKRRDGREVEMPEGCVVDWAHTGASSDVMAWRKL